MEVHSHHILDRDEIPALLAVAVIVGGLFVWRLRTAPEPLIPIAILQDPVARYAILSNSFGWGAIIGLNIFLPMFLQNVLAMSATAAGLDLMVLMATLNMSAGLSSPLIARHRRYKLVPLIGLAIAILSVAVLAWRGGNLSQWQFEVLLAVLGIGFGPLAPLTGVALQNTVAMHQFGTAVGTMNFLRSLYATVLVAVFGAIVLGGVAGAGETGVAAGHSGAAFQVVFVVTTISLLVSFAAMFILEEKPLATSHAV